MQVVPEGGTALTQDDMRDQLRLIMEVRDRWRAVRAEAEAQVARFDEMYARASGESFPARHRKPGRPHLRVVKAAIIGAGLAAASLLRKKAAASVTAMTAASVMAVGLAGPAISPQQLWHAIHAPALTAPAGPSLQVPRRRRRAELPVPRHVTGAPGSRTRHQARTAGQGRRYRGAPSPAPSPDPAPSVHVSVPVPLPLPPVSVSAAVPRVRRLLPHPVRSLVPVLLPSPPPGCTVDLLGICVAIDGG